MENPSDGQRSNVGPTTPEVAHGPILLTLLLTNQSLNDQYLGSSAPSGPTPGTTFVDEAVAELTDFSDEGMESFQSEESTQGGGETIEEGMEHDVPQAARGALTLLLTNQNNNANNANQPTNGTTVVNESAAELTDFSDEGMESFLSVKSTQGEGETIEDGMGHDAPQATQGALLTLLLTNQNNNANNANQPMNGTTVVCESVAELTDLSEERVEPPSSTKSTQYAEEETDVAEPSANSHGVSGAPILLTLLLTNQNNNANNANQPMNGTTVVHEHFAELVDIRGEIYDLLYRYHFNHLTRA